MLSGPQLNVAQSRIWLRSIVLLIGSVSGEALSSIWPQIVTELAASSVATEALMAVMGGTSCRWTVAITLGFLCRCAPASACIFRTSRTLLRLRGPRQMGGKHMCRPGIKDEYQHFPSLECLEHYEMVGP